MKKLVITNGKYYIGEDNNGYFKTESLNDAKDFKWCWLFARKKDFLDGINNRFNNRDNFRFENM